MTTKKKRRKRKQKANALLILVPAAIAAMLVIILVSWVLADSRKAVETAALPEVGEVVMAEPIPVPETVPSVEAVPVPETEEEPDQAQSLPEEEEESAQETESAEESLPEEAEEAETESAEESQPETAAPAPDPEPEPEPETQPETQPEAVVGTMDDTQDPQTAAGNAAEGGTGAVVELADVPAAVTENAQATLGIDVSKYQGTIDWAAVKSTGIDFAIIRVGYRTMETGTLTEDPGARYNLQEATKHGIKVGAYFFSTAISEAEAVEEANWVANFISQYKITYPVAYNCEGFNRSDSRQYSLTKQQRSALARVFLDTIAAHGYTPMFYASRNEMEGSAQWDMSVLGTRYKVWVSQYPEKPFPETPAPTYSGAYAMWQYTSKGRLYGIKGNVDVNVAYFGYDREAQAKNSTPAAEVTASPELGIDFKEVSELVTAKNETNLRNIPTTQGSQVVHLLKNGEWIQRTGVGSNGWDRVIYNGQTLYAVHNYLVGQP